MRPETMTVKREPDVDNLLGLFDLVGVLARRRYQLAERHFSALGLNHTEARLLTLLTREGGAAAQETLSGMLHVDRSNAGRGLKRLEAEGYVSRRQDETDKRSKLIQITAKGREATVSVSKLRRRIAQDLFQGLTDEQVGEVFSLLQRIDVNRGDEVR
jgi:DNA-binding MarR family transcriptional regulator